MIFKYFIEVHSEKGGMPITPLKKEKNEEEEQARLTVELILKTGPKY